jgi:hypothetical protein
MACRYSPAWHDHVMSLLPFYLLLFTAFSDLMLGTARIAPDHVLRLFSTVATVRSGQRHFDTLSLFFL